MEDKPIRKVIMSKSRGVRYEQKFFKEIQEAILDGYRLPENPDRTTVSMRNFKGGGRCVLFLEGSEQTKPEVKPEVKPKVDPLEGMTRKADLLAFAKANDIEIDSEITQPVKIKKIIKEALQK